MNINKSYVSDYSKKKLPKGAYIIKILGFDICTSKNREGYYLKVSFDIADGQYMDFYANDYKMQPWEDKKWHGMYMITLPNNDGTEKDNYIKKLFCEFVSTIEECNPGYKFDWEERKMVGLLAGGLFNFREYRNRKNRVIKVTNLAKVCSVDDVRNGRYKLPKDKLLGKESLPESSRANIELIYDSSIGDFYHYERI